MSKPDTSHDDGMQSEYDFTDGQRGRYTKRMAEGSNVVVLSPDVAEAFPDSQSVNDALRKLMRQDNPDKAAG